MTCPSRLGCALFQGELLGRDVDPEAVLNSRPSVPWPRPHRAQTSARRCCSGQLRQAAWGTAARTAPACSRSTGASRGRGPRSDGVGIRRLGYVPSYNPLSPRTVRCARRALGWAARRGGLAARRCRRRNSEGWRATSRALARVWALHPTQKAIYEVCVASRSQRLNRCARACVTGRHRTAGQVVVEGLSRSDPNGDPKELFELGLPPFSSRTAWVTCSPRRARHGGPRDRAGYALVVRAPLRPETLSAPRPRLDAGMALTIEPGSIRSSICSIDQKRWSTRTAPASQGARALRGRARDPHRGRRARDETGYEVLTASIPKAPTRSKPRWPNARRKARS